MTEKEKTTMDIIKRDGSKTKFDKKKIFNAIMKSMKYGSGEVNESVAKSISEDIERVSKMSTLEKDKVTTLTVNQIEELVYLKLIDYGYPLTARAYEGYRAIQSYRNKSNTTDDSILGLIQRTNEDVMNENSNKDAVIVSTQRDLIAGEVSKDISRRKKLPTRIVQAHDDGVLHFHK